MSTIVTRGGKGAPLTQGEMDGNFVNLNTDKVETASNLGATGAAVFESKADGNLAFRKIVAGTNVTVTQNTNDITIAASGGTPTPTAVSDQANTSTGYFGLPAGTTAQRPGSPAAGFTRFNTTTQYVEYYDGAAWWQTNQTRTFSADYLVIAGGGAGGGYISGGGGAGGVVQGTISLTPGSTYTATIGAGGTNTIGNNSVGGRGTDSSFTNVTTAVGGGGGAAGGGGAGSATSGGSGGGGGSTTASLAGAAGTSGQGFAGGSSPGQAVNFPSGGGGGSAAVGASPLTTASIGGAGGAGISSSITGSAVSYAGGGGGATAGSQSGGAGGAGGGGNGGSFSGAGAYLGSSTSGTANTGSGGGGGRGNGGSGVIILSLPTAIYTGTTTGSPTITTSGSNTIIKFTSSGSYTA